MNSFIEILNSHICVCRYGCTYMGSHMNVESIYDNYFKLVKKTMIKSSFSMALQNTAIEQHLKSILSAGSAPICKFANKVAC